MSIRNTLFKGSAKSMQLLISRFLKLANLSAVFKHGVLSDALDNNSIAKSKNLLISKTLPREEHRYTIFCSLSGQKGNSHYLSEEAQYASNVFNSTTGTHPNIQRAAQQVHHCEALERKYYNLVLSLEACQSL